MATTAPVPRSRYLAPPDPVTVEALTQTYREWPTPELRLLRTEFAAHVTYHQKRLEALDAVLAARTDPPEGRS